MTHRLLAFIVIFGAPAVSGLGAIEEKLSAIKPDGRAKEGGATAPSSRNRKGKLPAYTIQPPERTKLSRASRSFLSGKSVGPARIRIFPSASDGSSNGDFSHRSEQ